MAADTRAEPPSASFVVDAGGRPATVTVGEWVGSNTGKDLPRKCHDIISGYVGKTVLLPIYNDVTGQGNNGQYQVSGWAAFEILGYKFPGASHSNTYYDGAKCECSCAGLIGRFKRFALLDGSGYTPGGPNYGAAIVGLDD